MYTDILISTKWKGGCNASRNNM